MADTQPITDKNVMNSECKTIETQLSSTDAVCNEGTSVDEVIQTNIESGSISADAGKTTESAAVENTEIKQDDKEPVQDTLGEDAGTNSANNLVVDEVNEANDRTQQVTTEGESTSNYADTQQQQTGSKIKENIELDDERINESTAPKVQPENEQQGDMEKVSEKPAMTLDSIKTMMDNINSDINTLKSSADVSKSENNEGDASTGTGAEKTGPKEVDFDALRMRNDQLRQELLAIKKDQELRGPVAASITEQKIIESSKMNKLKDSTCSLETEIEIINKARKAQESLRKRQEERREAERKKRREENIDIGPVSVEDIKGSIQQLKKQMEDVINFPISEIDHSTPAVDDTGDTDETKKEQENVKSKNKKAKDDMLKKYLLATVMKQNIDTLTKKMNEMLAEQGIEPATVSDAPAKVEVAANQSDGKDETNQNKGKDETDEFYMYEEHGNDSDLYEEEECQVSGNNEEESQALKSDEEFSAMQKRKESVLAAAAKSISDVEALIYKGKETKQEPASTSNSLPIPQASNLSKSQKKKLKKRQVAQTDATKEPVKPHIATETSETSGDKSPSQGKITDDTTIPMKKIRTYNLLLKLQREMGSMQLQVSKLQDNMRSVNSALQEILSTEFDDM